MKKLSFYSWFFLFVGLQNRTRSTFQHISKATIQINDNLQTILILFITHYLNISKFKCQLFREMRKIISVARNLYLEPVWILQCREQIPCFLYFTQQLQSICTYIISLNPCNNSMEDRHNHCTEYNTGTKTRLAHSSSEMEITLQQMFPNSKKTRSKSSYFRISNKNLVNDVGRIKYFLSHHLRSIQFT